MKILTAPVLFRLESTPMGTHAETHAEDVPVIVKFFGGAACTWYVTEARQEGGDWRLFGLADLGMGSPELGDFMLSELTGIRFPPFGLPLERDRHWKGSLADAMRAQGMKVAPPETDHVRRGPSLAAGVDYSNRFGDES